MRGAGSATTGAGSGSATGAAAGAGAIGSATLLRGGLLSASAPILGSPAAVAAAASASGSPRVATAERPDWLNKSQIFFHSTLSGRLSVLLKSRTASSPSKKSGLLPVNSARAVCSVAGSVGWELVGAKVRESQIADFLTGLGVFEKLQRGSLMDQTLIVLRLVGVARFPVSEIAADTNTSS